MRARDLGMRLLLAACVTLGALATDEGAADAQPRKPKPILPVRRDPPPDDASSSDDSGSGGTTKMPVPKGGDKSDGAKDGAKDGKSGDKGDGKSEKGKDGFPMAAEDYQSQCDAKIEKAREKIEKATAKMNQSTADLIKKKFERAVASMNKELAKAKADGTITRAEADKIEHAFQQGANGGTNGMKKTRA